MKKITILLVLLLTAGMLVASAKKSSKTKTESLSKSNTDSGKQTFTVNDVSFVMVKVDGGTFMMGATREQGIDAYNDEKLAHKVKVSSFLIGQAEVTQELWQAVMGDNPSWFNGTGNSKYGSNHSENYDANLKRPVEYVSWDDCQEFILKLNQLTGKNFRLPTEAEWEYAARGGRKSCGYKYAGGNTLDDVAWYYKKYDLDESSPDFGTHTIATKLPNELGIFDMSGNVWEWCQDRWYHYDGSRYTGNYRVNRGGSWVNFARDCRVSVRGINSPDYRSRSHGLRLAL